MEIEKNLGLAADFYNFCPDADDSLCQTISDVLQEEAELSEEDLEYVNAAAAPNAFAEMLRKYRGTD